MWISWNIISWSKQQNIFFEKQNLMTIYEIKGPSTEFIVVPISSARFMFCERILFANIIYTKSTMILIEFVEYAHRTTKNYTKMRHCHWQKNEKKKIVLKWDLDFSREFQIRLFLSSMYSFGHNFIMMPIRLTKIDKIVGEKRTFQDYNFGKA